MVFLYARVSTEEQNLSRQEDLVKRYAVDKVFSEKISGKNTERPKLQALLDIISEGDTVVVESYSRLSRSTKDLLSIVDHFKSKKVNFISDKEKIDTTTPTGKLFFTITAGIVEYERELLLQRQKEGIAIAKAQGIYKGRKPISFNINLWKTYYPAIKSKELSSTKAMEVMGLKKMTYHKHKKMFEATLKA